MGSLGIEGDGPVRVLLVDDVSADDLAERLAAVDEALEAIPVSRVETAMARVRSQDIDCIVADHDLTGTDGLEFFESVRQERPQVPFILYPASGSEALASEAAAAGVTGYVSRGSGTDNLEVLVDRIEGAVSDGDVQSAASVHARYEKLIHYSTDVVFVVDANGTYQYVSPAVEGILGYEPSELVGVNGFDLVHPDDREATMAEFFRAVEHPEHEPTVEFRAEHRDGSWRWLEVRGRNRLDDPVVGGFVVNARDVTERKAYERQLAEHDERFRRIAEHLPKTVIWMTDAAFAEVAYVSPGYEDLWGRPVDHLYDNPESFLHGVHPDDRDRVLDAMAGLTASAREGDLPAVDQIEYRVVHPDGTVRWVRGRSVPVVDADGAVSQWIGIATDVTERKERERELEGYETLIQTVPDGVYLVDADGRMRTVNAAWASMVGKPVDELVGQPFETLVEEGAVDASVVARFEDLLRDLLSADTDRDRGALVIRTSLPGQSAEHVYEAHVALLPYDDEYRGSAVVVRDITDSGRPGEPAPG